MSQSYYKTVKNSLHKVIWSDEKKEVLRSAANTVNKIVIHTKQFIKAYTLDRFAQQQPLPLIDKPFVTDCMRVVRGQVPTGNTTHVENMNCLISFYNEHYQSTMASTSPADMKMENLGQILEYSATSIVTQYNNNIQPEANYVKYVERFINIIFDKKGKMATLTDQDKKKEFLAELRSYKVAVLERKEGDHPKQLKEHFRKIIVTDRPFAMPKDSKESGTLPYDLACHPEDYFPKMVYMMQQVENTGNAVYSVFPARTTCIPRNIRVDTATLVMLLMTATSEYPAGAKTKQDIKLNLTSYQDEVWQQFFRTNKKCFCPARLPVGGNQPGYQFAHMIETDGTSCSILLQKRENVVKKGGKYRGDSGKKAQRDDESVYLEDLSKERLAKLANKRVVGIDPGKDDLIYCVEKGPDGDREGMKKFRYSHVQRKFESKEKMYKNIRKQMKG